MRVSLGTLQAAAPRRLGIQQRGRKHRRRSEEEREQCRQSQVPESGQPAGRPQDRDESNGDDEGRRAHDELGTRGQEQQASGERRPQDTRPPLPATEPEDPAMTARCCCCTRHSSR